MWEGAVFIIASAKRTELRTVNIVIDSRKKTQWCPCKAGYALSLIQKIDCFRTKCSKVLLFVASSYGT